jgi:hypothetical protein
LSYNNYVNNELLAFKYFKGSVNRRQISQICLPFRQEYKGFPDPVPRIIEMLGQPKFAQLAVVSALLAVAEDNIDDSDHIMRRVKLHMLDGEDPNLTILFEYHSLLSDALLLTMNQGVLSDRRQVHLDHVDIAEQVVRTAPLFPTLTIMDLPSLEQTGGRTDLERNLPKILNKYDRNDYYRRYYSREV